MPKITVAAAPKKFEGHIKIIQDNAIKSWMLLFGAQNICLFGDEETQTNTKRLGTKYAKPDYSDTNVPLLDSILKISRSFGTEYTLFINSDIILMDDFKQTFELLTTTTARPFMAVGHRTNLDFDQPIDFGSAWQEKLTSLSNQKGVLASEKMIDYFLFPSNRFKTIPALRVGRPGIDNTFLYWARRKERLDLIDITESAKVIHQNHDYSYFPGGQPAIYSSPDRNINFELGGGRYHYYFFISECNLILKNGNLGKKSDFRYYLSSRYVFSVLPALHPTFIFLVILKSLASRLKKNI